MLREKESGLDKRQNQKKISIPFIAVLATDECWPEDWHLGA